MAKNKNRAEVMRQRKLAAEARIAEFDAIRKTLKHAGPIQPLVRRCDRCGKTLTDPISRANRLGPVCVHARKGQVNG